MSSSNQVSNGDVVELNSGGPLMTVVDASHSQGQVLCQWFSGSAMQSGIFPAFALNIVKAAGH